MGSTTKERVKVTLIGIGSTIVDKPSMEEMAQREVEPESKTEIKSEIKECLIKEARQEANMEEEREIEIEETGEKLRHP